MMRWKNIKFLSLTILLALVQVVVAQDFVHPGGLHTQKGLDRMKEKVAAKGHPWIDGWNALIRDRKAQADYEPLPQPHMISRQRAGGCRRRVPERTSLANLRRGLQRSVRRTHPQRLVPDHE